MYMKLDKKLDDNHTIWDCMNENSVDYVLPILCKIYCMPYKFE